MSENEPAQDESVPDEQQSNAPDADDREETIEEVSQSESEFESESESESESASESKSESEQASDKPPADLIQRIEDSDPEQLAREIESLRGQVDEHQATIDDLESRLKRKQADFQNYKKRMEKRREQERKRATEDLITRIIDVRDNLKRGLEQDGEIREGIETTLRQFDRVLEQENVTEITPEPGEAVDPQRHEVLMRVESDQPEDTIDSVHRSGYEMADKIIREAQVTVSDADGE